MLSANLLVATLMVGLTTIVHLVFLTGLTWLMQKHEAEKGAAQSFAKPSVTIVLVVLGLFMAHSVEIWMYAVLYDLFGMFDTFETSLYFSTSTFTTVGFGEVVAGPKWRLLTAIESANGFILIGWSTAFLISLTARLRAVEHRWMKSKGEN